MSIQGTNSHDSASGANPLLPEQQIDPSDPRYRTLTSGFNQRWPSSDIERAAKVLVCKSVSEVLSAVSLAYRDLYGRLPNKRKPVPTTPRSTDYSTEARITIRSGGHCYEGFVSENPSGYIIDVGPMSGFEKNVHLKPTHYHDNVTIARTKHGNKGLEAQTPTGDLTYKYKVLPGTMNWDGYVNMYKTDGVTIPGGSCYSVGTGGHISGGGYGLLSRLQGLTSDWLTAVDVVLPPTADRSEPALVHAKRPDSDGSGGVNEDLFQLCCGAGGGNVGVITAFYFDELPKAPSDAVLLFVTIPWNQFESSTDGKRKFNVLIRSFVEYFEKIDQDHTQRDLFSILHVPHHSKDITMTVQCVNIDLDNNDRLEFAKRVNSSINALFSALSLSKKLTDDTVEYKLSDTTAHFRHSDSLPMPQKSNHPVQEHLKGDALEGAVAMNWLEAVQYANGSGHNRRGKYKSAYLKSVPAQFSDGLHEALTSKPNELISANEEKQLNVSDCIVAFDSYGGAINGKSSSHDSVFQRSSYAKIQYQAYWHDYELDEKYVSWLNRVYMKCFPTQIDGFPWDSNDDHYQGCYINYPDIEMLEFERPSSPYTGTPHQWLELYFGPEIGHDLMQAKQKYDPLDVFHHAMSIPLPESMTR